MVNSNKNKPEKKTALRIRRIFSESIRKQTVKDIESGRCTVLQASRELQVSDKSIYTWLDRYSRYLGKNKIMIVEEKSEAYRSKQLEQRIKELEAALGRKQLEMDLLNKIIELANEEYGTDLKKNLPNRHSNGTGSIKESNTGTK